MIQLSSMHETLNPEISDSPEELSRVESFINTFLIKLQEDHPQLATEIKNTRLPNYKANAQILWQEFQDALSETERTLQIEDILQQEKPDPEFMQALLEGINKLRYISREETHRIMAQYAAEVEAVLQGDPSATVIFVTEYAGEASETYFARMVHQMLPQPLQTRILFSDEVVSKDIPQSLSDNHYIIYRFDDSSNSGAQVNASIKSTIHQHGRRTRHLDFRVRLIAGGSETQEEHVKERVDGWVVKNGPPGAQYTLDWKQEFLNERIEVVYKGQTVTWGTSMIFSHKIQDNLPDLYLSLSEHHRRDKPHLFEMDTDIRPPYKS